MPKSSLSALPEPLRAKIREQDGHWLWIGTLVQGYGLARWNREGDYAHRLVYRLLVGKIPAGRHVHHKCRERACVNPEHLEVLTQSAHSRHHASGKTHCKHGHEWTPENTHWARGPNGLYRHCRECQRRRNRESRAGNRRP